MTPQERQEFEMMKQEIQLLKSLRDVSFREELRRANLGISVDREESASSINTVADATNVLRAADGKLRVVDQRGRVHFIPRYNS